MARAKKLSLQLPCAYTDVELNEKRDHLAAVIVEISAVEDRKASVAREFKEVLDGLYADSNRVAREIRAKSENRLTECIVEYDKPNRDEKTTIRLDTGEMVKTEVMTEEERQEEIEFSIEDRQSIKDLLDTAHPEDGKSSDDQPPEAA